MVSFGYNALMLTREDLEKLAKLSRLALREEGEEKLLGDLEKILQYFKELEGVNTNGVAPMNGGTAFMNIMRDEEGEERLPLGLAKETFPEVEGGYLKVPPVFHLNGEEV